MKATKAGWASEAVTRTLLVLSSVAVLISLASPWMIDRAVAPSQPVTAGAFGALAPVAACLFALGVWLIATGRGRERHAITSAIVLAASTAVPAVLMAVVRLLPPQVIGHPDITADLRPASGLVLFLLANVVVLTAALRTAGIDMGEPMRTAGGRPAGFWFGELLLAAGLLGGTTLRTGTWVTVATSDAVASFDGTSLPLVGQGIGLALLVGAAALVAGTGWSPEGAGTTAVVAGWMLFVGSVAAGLATQNPDGQLQAVLPAIHEADGLASVTSTAAPYWTALSAGAVILGGLLMASCRRGDA